MPPREPSIAGDPRPGPDGIQVQAWPSLAMSWAARRPVCLWEAGRMLENGLQAGAAEHDDFNASLSC
eukprot:1805633-Pyramimonas_sp.AAC.1